MKLLRWWVNLALKTTVSRIILGLEEPSSGEISLMEPDGTVLVNERRPLRSKFHVAKTPCRLWTHNKRR